MGSIMDSIVRWETWAHIALILPLFTNLVFLVIFLILGIMQVRNLIYIWTMSYCIVGLRIRLIFFSFLYLSIFFVFSILHTDTLFHSLI